MISVMNGKLGGKLFALYNKNLIRNTKSAQPVHGNKMKKYGNGDFVS